MFPILVYNFFFKGVVHKCPAPHNKHCILFCSC